MASLPSSVPSADALVAVPAVAPTGEVYVQAFLFGAKQVSLLQLAPFAGAITCTVVLGFAIWLAVRVLSVLGGSILSRSLNLSFHSALPLWQVNLGRSAMLERWRSVRSCAKIVRTRVCALDGKGSRLTSLQWPCHSSSCFSQISSAPPGSYVGWTMRCPPADASPSSLCINFAWAAAGRIEMSPLCTLQGMTLMVSKLQKDRRRDPGWLTSSSVWHHVTLAS